MMDTHTHIQRSIGGADDATEWPPRSHSQRGRYAHIMSLLSTPCCCRQLTASLPPDPFLNKILTDVMIVDKMLENFLHVGFIRIRCAHCFPLSSLSPPPSSSSPCSSFLFNTACPLPRSSTRAATRWICALVTTKHCLRKVCPSYRHCRSSHSHPARTEGAQHQSELSAAGGYSYDLKELGRYPTRLPHTHATLCDQPTNTLFRSKLLPDV